MPTCARFSGVATTAGGLTDPRRARMGLSSLRRMPLQRRHRPPHVRCCVEPIGAAAPDSGLVQVVTVQKGAETI